MVTYIQWGQGVRTCTTLRGVRNPKAEGDEDQKQVLLRSAQSPSSWLSSGGAQSRHIRNWEPAPLKISVIASSVSKKERRGLPLKYTPWPDVHRNDGIPAWLRPNASLQPQRSQGAVRSARWYSLSCREYSDDYFIKCFLWKRYRRHLFMSFPVTDIKWHK